MKSLFKIFRKDSPEPRFIRGSDFGSVLEHLLCDANKFITLVSPYIKLNARIRNTLQTKLEENATITIICREGFSDQNLASSVYYRSNLHAKCYIRENAFLMGSMNLYDYSQTHNDEFGIFINRLHFPCTYESCLIEIKRLMQDYTNKNTSILQKHNIANKNVVQKPQPHMFELNKKYNNNEIKGTLDSRQDLKGGINIINDNTIVLIWKTSSHYKNKQLGDTIYFVGQNTGGGKQQLVYGNRALYDSFGSEVTSIYLFRDQIFCGKVFVSEEPYYEGNQLIFPLKFKVGKI